MGTTANRGLRYPEGSVLANTLHTHIKNLADDVDAKLFDTGWTSLTLDNGWGQYGGFSAARYRKFQGLVHVTGLITRASAPAQSSAIATLPAGYRFTGAQRIYIPATDTGAGRLDINPSGQILWVGGGFTWFSLDCIIPYIAEA